MKHELLLKWIFSKLNLTKEYFESISSEITKSCNELIKTVKLISEMFLESYELEKEYQTKFSGINERYYSVIHNEIIDPDFRQLFAPVLSQMNRSLEYINQRVEIKSELTNLVGNKENYLINELIRKMKFLEVDQMRVFSQINDYKRNYCDYLNKCINCENEKTENLKIIRKDKNVFENVYIEIFVKNKKKSHYNRVLPFRNHKDKDISLACQNYLINYENLGQNKEKEESKFWKILSKEMRKIKSEKMEKYSTKKSQIIGDFLKTVEEETEGIRSESVV